MQILDFKLFKKYDIPFQTIENYNLTFKRKSLGVSYDSDVLDLLLNVNSKNLNTITDLDLIESGIENVTNLSFDWLLVEDSNTDSFVNSKMPFFFDFISMKLEFQPKSKAYEYTILTKAFNDHSLFYYTYLQYFTQVLKEKKSNFLFLGRSYELHYKKKNAIFYVFKFSKFININLKRFDLKFLSFLPNQNSNSFFTHCLKLRKALKLRKTFFSIEELSQKVIKKISKRKQKFLDRVAKINKKQQHQILKYLLNKKSYKSNSSKIKNYINYIKKKFQKSLITRYWKGNLKDWKIQSKVNKKKLLKSYKFSFLCKKYWKPKSIKAWYTEYSQKKNKKVWLQKYEAIYLMHLKKQDSFKNFQKKKKLKLKKVLRLFLTPLKKENKLKLQKTWKSFFIIFNPLKTLKKKLLKNKLLKQKLKKKNKLLKKKLLKHKILKNKLLKNLLLKQKINKYKQLKQKTNKTKQLKQKPVKNKLLKTVLKQKINQYKELKQKLVKNKLLKKNLLKKIVLKQNKTNKSKELKPNKTSKFDELKQKLKKKRVKIKLLKIKLLKKMLLKNKLLQKKLLKNDFLKNKKFKNKQVKQKLFKNEKFKNKQLKKKKSQIKKQIFKLKTSKWQLKKKLLQLKKNILQFIKKIRKFKKNIKKYKKICKSVLFLFRIKKNLLIVFEKLQKKKEEQFQDLPFQKSFVNFFFKKESGDFIYETLNGSFSSQAFKAFLKAIPFKKKKKLKKKTSLRAVNFFFQILKKNSVQKFKNIFFIRFLFLMPYVILSVDKTIPISLDVFKKEKEILEYKSIHQHFESQAIYDFIDDFKIDIFKKEVLLLLTLPNAHYQFKLYKPKTFFKFNTLNRIL